MAGDRGISRWFTPKRIRAHGFILALCLWTLYFWNMATPGLRDRAGNLKGTDFLHLYTLGSLALAHQGADLYNMQAQAELAARRVPAAMGIRYLPLYPPQASIVFSPFARLSYGWALLLWLVASTGIYGLCTYLIWRACPGLQPEKATVLILAIAFPAFWHLLLWGQTSALALACFALAFIGLRSDHLFLAGLALGSLMFKPQLGLAAAIIFLAARQWMVVAGAIAASVFQLTTAWLYYGLQPLRAWVHIIAGVSSPLPFLEPKPYQTHSLRTFWTMLLPWSSLSLTLYPVSAILILALTIRCWNSSLPLSLRYSALLLATVLVSPHLTVYDLEILGPALLLLSDWCKAHPDEHAAARFAPLLYLAYVLPLAGPLARWTHLQLTIPVMIAILVVIYQVSTGPLRLDQTREIASRTLP